MKLFQRLILASVMTSFLAACTYQTANIEQDEDSRQVQLIANNPYSFSSAQVGPRPFYLVDQMDESPLKTRLQSCETAPFYRTDFSISHRGAAMQFPEHTRESYLAGAQMGAGILECDVAFTKDQELVCRHSQCDLHTTTNILLTELADQCNAPFSPANGSQMASARCCTSDITLAQFKTLRGKMDGANPKATTVEEYVQGTPGWRTDLYATDGTLMSHADSIALFKELGVKMTPELKTPSVPMPFEGFTQQGYAAKMAKEYLDADVAENDVFMQSFLYADIQYWLEHYPTFADQLVYLDDRYGESVELTTALENNLTAEQMNKQPELLKPTMAELAADGLKIIAPPLWTLVTVKDGAIVPSEYAKAAKAAGLKIIAWSLERSGPMANGGGWYYMSLNGSWGDESVINNDGDIMELLHVLAQDVGVIGVFSDWPGTVSYYASCVGMPAS
ncbi:MAG: glycerophosphodiester phosphodiesterase family protein [Oceanobacter sp.]